MDQDVTLSDGVEHRARGITQLRRRRRYERRIAQLRYVHRGDPHQVAEVEHGAGLDQVVVGERRHLARLLLAQLGENQLAQLGGRPLLHFDAHDLCESPLEDLLLDRGE